MDGYAFGGSREERERETYDRNVLGFNPSTLALRTNVEKRLIG